MNKYVTSLQPNPAAWAEAENARLLAEARAVLLAGMGLTDCSAIRALLLHGPEAPDAEYAAVTATIGSWEDENLPGSLATSARAAGAAAFSRIRAAKSAYYSGVRHYTNAVSGQTPVNERMLARVRQAMVGAIELLTEE